MQISFCVIYVNYAVATAIIGEGPVSTENQNRLQLQSLNVITLNLTCASRSSICERTLHAIPCVLLVT